MKSQPPQTSTSSGANHYTGDPNTNGSFQTQAILQQLASTSDGLSIMQEFLTITLPSLPPLTQMKYCNEDKKCNLVPCTEVIQKLVEASIRANQIPTFVWLYDTFLLGPRKEEIPWPSLVDAAMNGSLELAKVFQEREEKWFDRKREQEDRECSLTIWDTQSSIAMSHGKFEYVDYMLELGADANIGGVQQSLLSEAVWLDINDGKYLDSIVFSVFLQRNITDRR